MLEYLRGRGGLEQYRTYPRFQRQTGGTDRQHFQDISAPLTVFALIQQ